MNRKKSFINNLKILRHQNGITQEDLAVKLGVSCRNIQRLESGEAVPNLTTLLKLEEVFNLKIEDFLKKDLFLANNIEVKLNEELTNL